MSEQPISAVAIANRALQKLGASRIDSFDQDKPNARSASACYSILRDKLLRSHPWNFAKKRASVAALTDGTTWGSLNRYQLPNDFLRLLRSVNDGIGGTESPKNWVIESDAIVTTDAAPLEFIYIARITDPAKFDALFIELLATTMAHEMCEEVTASNTKKADLKEDIRELLAEARRTNAIEIPPQEPPEDDWLVARL